MGDSNRLLATCARFLPSAPVSPGLSFVLDAQRFLGISGGKDPAERIREATAHALAYVSASGTRYSRPAITVPFQFAARIEPEHYARAAIWAG